MLSMKQGAGWAVTHHTHSLLITHSVPREWCWQLHEIHKEYWVRWAHIVQFLKSTQVLTTDKMSSSTVPFLWLSLNETVH